MTSLSTISKYWQYWRVNTQTRFLHTVVRAAKYFFTVLPTIVLKLYHYIQFDIASPCFDVSWSSSGGYSTALKRILYKKHGLINILKFARKIKNLLRSTYKVSDILVRFQTNSDFLDGISRNYPVYKISRNSPVYKISRIFPVYKISLNSPVYNISRNSPVYKISRKSVQYELSYAKVPKHVMYTMIKL